jgi:hypothetical protein
VYPGRAATSVIFPVTLPGPLSARHVFFMIAKRRQLVQNDGLS